MEVSVLKMLIIMSAMGIIVIEGKIFDRCELARTLIQAGIPSYQLSTWVCIAQRESNYNTNAYNLVTGDHGIFQISEIYWCNASGGPGKGCNARCSDFQNDNISDDIKCIRHIYDETQRLSGNGFTAWTTYQYCNGDTSVYTAGC